MSKYHAKKVKIDGITFDSKAEGDYYLLLKRQKELGKIKDFDLQPRFELLPKFEVNGTKFQDIEYVADFRVHNLDGSSVVIDVKGKETADFRLKYKMYMYKFGKIEPLILIAHSRVDGGWIELSDLKKNRKVRGKVKKVEKERKLEEQKLREANYMIDQHLEYVTFFIRNKMECTDKFKNSLIKYVKENYHTIDELMEVDDETLPKTYKRKIVELKNIIKLEKNT